jgi:hypothetical protein
VGQSLVRVEGCGCGREDGGEYGKGIHGALKSAVAVRRDLVVIDLFLRDDDMGELRRCFFSFFFFLFSFFFVGA